MTIMWQAKKLFNVFLIAILLFPNFLVDGKLACWSCTSKVSMYCPEKDFQPEKGVGTICRSKERCGKEIYSKRGQIVVRRGCYKKCFQLNETLFCETCNQKFCNTARNIHPRPKVVFLLLSVLIIVNVRK